jgi:hypothetical protein
MIKKSVIAISTVLTLAACGSGAQTSETSETVLGSETSVPAKTVFEPDPVIPGIISVSYAGGTPETGEYGIWIEGIVTDMSVDYSNATRGFAHLQTTCDGCLITVTNLDDKYSLDTDFFSRIILGFPGYPPLVGLAMFENKSGSIGPSQSITMPFSESPSTPPEYQISEEDALAIQSKYRAGEHFLVLHSTVSECEDGRGSAWGIGVGYGCEFYFGASGLNSKNNPFDPANRSTTECKVYVPHEIPPFNVCDYSLNIAPFQDALGVNSDGFFGFETQDAVKKYQASRNLPVTGQIDSNTAESLIPGTLGH